MASFEFSDYFEKIHRLVCFYVQRVALKGCTASDHSGCLQEEKLGGWGMGRRQKFYCRPFTNFWFWRYIYSKTGSRKIKKTIADVQDKFETYLEKPEWSACRSQPEGGIKMIPVSGFGIEQLSGWWWEWTLGRVEEGLSGDIGSSRMSTHNRLRGGQLVGSRRWKRFVLNIHLHTFISGFVWLKTYILEIKCKSSVTYTTKVFFFYLFVFLLAPSLLWVQMTLWAIFLHVMAQCSKLFWSQVSTLQQMITLEQRKGKEKKRKKRTARWIVRLLLSISIRSNVSNFRSHFSGQSRCHSQV